MILDKIADKTRERVAAQKQKFSIFGNRKGI